ncbi:hypothetical protein [Streptomyces sp. UH6]|uniref:hypothetical protein n=1 Tax=Streptomyces sp. UH6 TaxID=2748379 RepID=UPI0015D5211E|nr:hypothetical protein [Streptomyces sp. UH6]NYV73181.1 hypothetical protein [Streptomyces sp. UH6]
MANIADILKAAKPRERTVRLCLSGDLAGEAARLQDEIARVTGESWEPMSMADRHPARALAEQLAEINRQIKDSETEFRFRYIGDRKYSDLMAAHPAKDENQAFDSETFPRALISASCVDPVMDEDQAAELFEVITQGQVKELFDAAWDVHTSRSGAVPFSLAASALLAGLGGES